MKAEACSKTITLQLREAVNRLEAYVSSRGKDTTSIVSRTLASMHSLLASHIGIKKNGKDLKCVGSIDEISEIGRAVEFILRQRLLIQKLKHGTSEERALAESFTRTIEAYNQSRDIRIHRHGMDIFGFGFFSDWRDATSVPPKITLPRHKTIKQCYPANTSQDTTLHQSLSSTAIASAAVLLRQQSIELFWMKALRLLEGFGIAIDSMVRAQVRQTPISASVQQDGLTCTLTQTLHVFPWQTVVIAGKSELDPKTSSIGNLFSASFKLRSESIHTGFPHPSQRAGWTLASELIPEHPQRVDLLNVIADLFRRKELAVDDLESEGRFLKSAKALFLEKTKLFQTHIKEMVSLHEQLTMTLLRAAPQTIVPLDAETIVKRFYEQVVTHPAPYDWLSETHQTLKDLFISNPRRALLEAILNGKSTGFGSRQPEDRYHACQQFLEDVIKDAHNSAYHQSKTVKLNQEKIKFDFICCLGKILGNACINIILQYLSEDLIFPPPQLSSFESLVQAAAYQHLDDYLMELEHPPEDILNQMRGELLSDISLFSSQDIPAVSRALTLYFDNRFSSLTF